MFRKTGRACPGRRKVGTAQLDDPRAVLSLLEADQVVAAKRRTHFGRKNLSFGTRSALESARLCRGHAGDRADFRATRALHVGALDRSPPVRPRVENPAAQCENFRWSSKGPPANPRIMASNNLLTASPNLKFRPSALGFLVAFVIVAIAGSVVVYSLSDWSAGSKPAQLQNPVPATQQAIGMGMSSYTRPLPELPR